VLLTVLCGTFASSAIAASADAHRPSNDLVPVPVPVPVRASDASAASASDAAAEALSGGRTCAGDIGSITFEGNRVTRAHVLARELPQRVGMPCDIESVLAGLARLEALGLFRSVRIELHTIPERDDPVRYAGALSPAILTATRLPAPIGALDKVGTGIDGREDDVPVARELLELRYVVREKFFFLGLPRLSRTSDGEVRAGVSLEWTNFLGRLHEMKLTSEWRQEDDGQGLGGFVSSLDYDVPRFFGSSLGLGISLDVADRQVGFHAEGDDAVATVGEGQLEAYALGMTLAHWLNDSDGVQGLRVFYGAAIARRDYALVSGERGTSHDGTDLGWRIGIEQRSVHRDRYRRRGVRFGGAFSFADERLGSDFDWHRADGWLAWYHPLGTERDNLNVALGLGISDGAPFGDRAYAVGGGEVLRGVDKGAREGDVRLLLNVEYLRAVRRLPAFRWVVFVDAGNVWPIDDVDAADLLVRGGIGARYKLEALSRRDLRIDLAWDPVEARVVPYLSTRLTF